RFHENDFRRWREEKFKGYLAAKRKEEEAAKKRYGRPFIDYLDEAEREMFGQFWERYRWHLITLFLTGENRLIWLQEPKMAPYVEALLVWQQELEAGAHVALQWVGHYHRLKGMVDEIDLGIIAAYLKTLRSYNDLDRPLLGIYSGMRRSNGKQFERELASAFYPTYGYGYARSQAFRQATTIGSIFKLIPAYEALRQRYVARGGRARDLNPLTIVDDKHRTNDRGGWSVGYTQEGKSIPMFYRGGRLVRSEHANVGRVDLSRALEASSNPYFSLLAGDVLEDPEDLCHAARLFGFGAKTGIALPGEIRGNIPDDVAYNRSGLYALAIGQHTLVGTPLQTAVMLSALANGGKILTPKIVSDEESEVRWQIFLPDEMRTLMLNGMRQVVMGDKGTAREIRKLFPAELVSKIVGKTSTAEAVEKLSLDGTSGRLKSKHIWFGAIAFKDENFNEPELVVVVYLRLGEFGRLAAPLAVNMIQKWHEICK
nr:Penicillin-binding protein 2B [Chlamydiota bacterium]